MSKPSNKGGQGAFALQPPASREPEARQTLEVEAPSAGPVADEPVKFVEPRATVLLTITHGTYGRDPERKVGELIELTLEEAALLTSQGVAKLAE